MMDSGQQFDQTDALYGSEWSAIKSNKTLGRKMGPWRAQRLVRKVTGNPKARVKIDRRLGKFDIHALAQTNSEDWYGKPGDTFFNPRGRILPSRRMEVGAILHEAAHHMSPEPGHGEEFAKTYVDTVGSALGESAANTLKTHFEQGGVNH
jgi:hypothetical protein